MNETPPLPKYLQIEPVGQCNLRCTMCPIQFREDGPPHGPPAFMPYEKFVGLLEQFPALETLHLQGLGEPMMHPRFFDMVSHACGKGIRVTSNSNFTLLNSERAERCVTSGLHTLHISVDAPTAESYAKIRVGGRFERLERNLERLQAARERHSSNRPRLKMVAVIMRQNLGQLPALVERAGSWGMESIFVQHLCHDFGESTLPEKYRPMRDFVEDQTLLHEDAECIDRYFQKARAVARELGIELRLPHTRPRPHPPGTPGPERCDWPWRGAYISYDGYAMPCCMVSTPDRINLGNMAQEDVIPVWHGEAFRDFRQQLASDEPHEVCRSCSIYWGTF